MDKNPNKLSKNNRHKEKKDKFSKGCSKSLNTTRLLPDKELLVWEKWIQIRKEETIKLGEKLNREPVDLAMNLIGKVREDVERKSALALSQIEQKPTVRGTLFERPLRLKQHCYCQPVYEVHRTKAELGMPQVIEHISVPKIIQETELGMTGDTRRNISQRLDANYIKYRQKREHELGENLRKIDPFRPSTSKLVIQGCKPKLPPPKLPTPPEITVNTPASFPEESSCDIYAIKINKTVFYKNIMGRMLTHLSILQSQSWHENCTSWSYYFNVPLKRAGRAKLSLQNLGTVSLSYCWKQIKKSLPFIPANTFEQVFFFNKNENVLSPGQCRDIAFTFVSDEVGIYNESWEITFANVYFFETVNEKLTINLHADSVENKCAINSKVESLKTWINTKAMINLADDILNEIIENIFANVPQTYPYKHYFLEAEMFVMKNPVCFYHQTEVAVMRELYSKEICPRETWSLSISDWRKHMISKEYDDRTKYYNVLKQFHSECLKPWYEDAELLNEKYRHTKNLLGQLANKLDKEYQRLTDLYMQKSQLDITHDTSKIIILDPFTQHKIRNIFYLNTYDHIADTVELISGILSSLDSNRWIEFDFCRR